jgi:hypothetical protein
MSSRLDRFQNNGAFSGGGEPWSRMATTLASREDVLEEVLFNHCRKFHPQWKGLVVEDISVGLLGLGLMVYGRR